MASRLPLTRSLRCRRVAFAKRLVRSSWSPTDWTASALQSRGWPLPRLSDSGLQRLSLHEATTQLDLARPAIIGGALREWPNPGSWELPSLLCDHAMVDCLVGLDDEGVGVELRLDDFAAYATSSSDDLPLYIFDEDLLDTLPALAAAYAVPSCFPHDLLSLCGSERPPHRWVLIGPERAGTEPHVDPHQSAAWNTLVTGTKRWFFFPPREDGGGGGGGGYGQDDEGGGMAAAWLHERYPLLTECELAGGIECVQEAGETVYVPNGWTHAVVNLSMSIAVTHNFVGTHNLAAAAAALLEEEPRLARQWIAALAGDAALRQLLPPSLVVMADSDRLCDTELGGSSEEDGGHDEVCRVQRFLRHRTIQ